MRLGLFGRPSKPRAATMDNAASAPKITAAFSPTNRKTQAHAQVNIISTLETIREKILVIDKREAFQNTKINAHAEEAKQKLQAGDKRAALLALKKKKQLENNVEKLMLMRSNLEDLVMSIETGTLTLQVQHGLSEGLAAQRQMGLDPEKLAEMQADIEEELARMEESANVLSTPYILGGEAAAQHNEDILADLAELEREVRREGGSIARSSVRMSTRVSAHSVTTTDAPAAVVVVEEEEEAVALAVTRLPDAPSHSISLYANEEEDEKELQRLAMDMAL